MIEIWSKTTFKRGRYNTELIDDLALELNGAKFISSCDIKKASIKFKIQIQMWCKLLAMCYSCSTEAFQKIISVNLEGLFGVINLVYDIFIWVATQEERDERLKALLVRLESLRLTLNETKFQFDVD